MMRSIICLLLFFSINVKAQIKKSVTDYALSITSKELMEQLYVYSSDYFQGRETGTVGQKRAVDFLRTFYSIASIPPAIGTDNYFQPMELEIKGRKVATENVAAVIKGTDHPNEYIVISSHLDHIVVNSKGEINNGADDDGSGTVSMLQIAQAFKMAADNGQGPKRSIIFLHVTGEEKGLLGSKYYTENPLYPLEDTIANLNVDMIGRVNPKRETDDPNYIYLIGSDKLSQELHNISEAMNDKYTQLELDYTYNDDNDPNRFYYRSDHYNFAKKNIPVIFYFNGTHEDYHRPGDTPDKILYPTLAKRSRLVFYTAWELANRKERIKLN